MGRLKSRTHSDFPSTKWTDGLVRVNAYYLSDYQPPLHLMLYQFVLNQLLWKCSRFTFVNVLLSQLDNRHLQVTICICSALAAPSTLLITTVSLAPITTTTTRRTPLTWANLISIYDLNTNCSIFSGLPYI